MGGITSGWALIQISQLSFYWSSQYSENFVRTRASRNNTVKFLDMKNKILLFLSILIAILKNHTRQSDGKETNAVLANFFFLNWCAWLPRYRNTATCSLHLCCFLRSTFLKKVVISIPMKTGFLYLCDNVHCFFVTVWDKGYLKEDKNHIELVLKVLDLP